MGCCEFGWKFAEFSLAEYCPVVAVSKLEANLCVGEEFQLIVSSYEMIKLVFLFVDWINPGNKLIYVFFF